MPRPFYRISFALSSGTDAASCSAGFDSPAALVVKRRGRVPAYLDKSQSLQHGERTPNGVGRVFAEWKAPLTKSGFGNT